MLKKEKNWALAKVLFPRTVRGPHSRNGRVSLGLVAVVLFGLVVLAVLVFRGEKGAGVPGGAGFSGAKVPGQVQKGMASGIQGGGKGKEVSRVEIPAGGEDEIASKESSFLEVEIFRKIRGGEKGERLVPAPGALLYLLDPERVSDREEFRKLWGENSFFFLEITKGIPGCGFKIVDPGRLVRLGERFEADGRGRVKLRPPRGRGFFLAGRKGDAWGFALLENPAHKLYRIFIEPLRSLRVKVTGYDGRPREGVRVGLEVSKGLPQEGTPLPRGGYRNFSGWMRTTDSTTGPDGMCEFKGYFQFARATIPEGAGEWFGEVHAEILQKEKGPGASFDPLDPPSGPIVLRLPPTGSLVVEVQYPPGAPHGRGGGVEVSRHMVPRTPGIRTAIQRTGKDSGRAFFPCLALGLKLDVTCTWEGPGGLPVEEKTVAGIQGPAKAGEVVKTRVVFGLPSPLVHVALAGPDGKPLSGKVVGIPGGPDLVTDSRGRVSFPLFQLEKAREGGKGGGGHEKKGLFPVKVFTYSEVPPWGRLVGKFEVPLGIKEDYSAGKILLRPGTVILAGRVVDWRGNPVAGAQVMISEDRGEMVSSGEGRGKSSLDPAMWMDVSKDDGSFAFFGWSGEGKVRLQVYRKPYFIWTKVVEAGKKDLLVVLKSGGTILVRFVSPEGVDPSVDLGLQAVPSGWRGDSPLPFPYMECAEYQKGDLFFLEHVPEGKVDLWVTPRLGPWFTSSSEDDGSSGPAGSSLEAHGVLCRVPGIEVKEGALVRDPRLSPLNLRGKVQKVRIELLYEGGGPREREVEVKVLGFGTYRLFGKKVEFPAPKRPLDLVVSVEGFKKKTLHQVVGKRVVVLEKE